MGQSASSADLKETCGKSCKGWGDKDLSTIKVDLALIKRLDALCNDCNDDPTCPGSTSHSKDKELVTDQENVPPKCFQVAEINRKPDQSEDVSTSGNEKEIKVPRLSLPNQGLQENCKQAVHLAEPHMQPMAPEVAAELELKVTLMEWSEGQQGLVRQEVLAIPCGNGIHPSLKVADFKTLLKEKKMLTPKSGVVLDIDHMVLTTPRRLELDRALNGLKTLAESGVAPGGPELLLLDTESVRKASAFNKKASQAEAEQKRLEGLLSRKASPRTPTTTATTTPRSDVEQKKASPRTPPPEAEHKVPGSKTKEKKVDFDEQRCFAFAEQEAKDKKIREEQGAKVKAWLKSAGFKDVNELVRKQVLTKTRPLHVAVQQGDAEMIRLLLLMGADPQLCNGKNETPLLYAKRISRERSLSTAAYLKVVSVLSPVDNMSGTKSEVQLLVSKVVQ